MIMDCKERIEAAKEQLKAADAVEYKLPDSAHAIRTAVYAIFPELKQSEDEKVRKEIINYLKQRLKMSPSIPTAIGHWIAWLEKQGEESSMAMWHSVSEVPEEMEELLCEWESDDATWHDVAFYHADTKTFWNGERQVDNVTRWCYIEKQGQKPAWSEEDEIKIKSIITFLKSPSLCAMDGNKGIIDANIKYLKSIKDRVQPQNTWKPSDEQMEALEHFIIHHNGSTNYAKDLEELRIQLKKL